MACPGPCASARAGGNAFTETLVAYALYQIIVILLDVLWWIIIIQAIMSWLIAFNVVNMGFRYVPPRPSSRKAQKPRRKPSESGRIRYAVSKPACCESTGDEPAALEAINIFERKDGKWLMIHHQAAPVLPQFAQEKYK